MLKIKTKRFVVPPREGNSCKKIIVFLLVLFKTFYKLRYVMYFWFIKIDSVT